MKKIFVLGLDGVTYDLLNPMLNHGHLPNLARVISEGVSKTLISTIPAVTPPSWTSMLTGVNPGKHGIFDFFHKDGYTAYPVTKYKGGSPLWRTLTQHGRKGIFLNIPCCYPPDKLNGIFTSGLLSPGEGANFVYPDNFKNRLFELAPDYKIDAVGNLGEINKEKAVSHISSITQSHIRIAKHLLEKTKDWGLFFMVLAGPDRLQHFYFQDILSHDPYLLNYYNEIDQFLGYILDHVIDEETYLFVVSDHGFMQLHRRIYINSLLHELGFLSLKKRFVQRNYVRFKEATKRFAFQNKKNPLISRIIHLGRGIDKMANNKHLLGGISGAFLSPDDVNWDKTRAFSVYADHGAVFLNIAGREPEGKVALYDKDKTINQLVKALQDVRDPLDGKEIFKKVVISMELYSGEFAKEAPDIILVPNKGYGFTSKIGNQPFGLSTVADHEEEGILILYGDSIERDLNSYQPRVEDIAPTILHLLKIPIPEDYDGKVLLSRKNEYLSKGKWKKRLEQLTK